MSQSDLEATMALHIKVLRQSDGRQWLTEPEKEYTFHPVRKWRFDFAWPYLMTAVEVEGGGWLQTKTGRSKGHAHPKRFEDDCDKYNEAAKHGWRVFRFTGDMVEDGRALKFLESVFAPF